MAAVKWDLVLTPDQRSNPVIRWQQVVLPAAIGRFPEMLETMFPAKTPSLKTWGRTPGVTEYDPHWIGVRKGTPLHTDKAYPRITHQLMVQVDDGFVLRGIDKVELPLTRGLYFVLDTHSPHQLFTHSSGPQWYLALSMDTTRDNVSDDVVLKGLMDYGGRFRFMPEDALRALKPGGQKLGRP